MSDYQKQARDFCEKHGVNFTAKFLRNSKYFDSDKESRDIYEIQLERSGIYQRFRNI